MEIVRLEISEELLSLMPDGFPIECLLELEAHAKANGNFLSDMELNDILPPSVDSPEAIDFMLEYLQSKGITITYQKDEDDDLISSTDSAEIEQFKALVEKIRNLMSTLSSRERDVLEWRLGLKGGRSHTLEEVGQIYGVTRERIRQIEAKALRRLRSKRCTQLRDFVADSEYENDKDVKNDFSKDLLFDYFKMLENNPYLINLLNEEENKTDSQKDKIVFVSTEARIEQLEKDNKILLEIIQNHFEYIQNLKAEIKDLKEKYEGLKIEVRSPKVEKEIHFTKDKYIGEHNKRECIRIRFIYDFKKGSEFCSDIVGSIKYEGLGVAVIYSPRAKGWLLYTKKGVDSESMNEAVKLFKDILIKGIINGEY